MAVNNADDRASNRVAREAESEVDRVLIEQARNGDIGAFKQLVERHQRRAFGIALALVRDEEDAREVVQEAFVRVYRGLGEFHGGSAFFTWLYRIVHNLSIDLMRKPARREIGLDAVTELEEAGGVVELGHFGDVDPHDRAHRRQLQDTIGKALDALPEYHRGVIVMREVYGMSYEEMAEAAGVSKGTIMSRLFHARKKLQLALARSYEEAFGAPPPAGGKEGE